MATDADVAVVALTWAEAALAAQVGCRRQIESVRLRKPDAHGRSPYEPGWNVHCEGACGEMAVAKYLGRFWDASVNTFKTGGDVGPDVHVRTRPHPHHDLHIRPGDPDAVFVHVSGVFSVVNGADPVYRILGWCYTADAKAAFPPERLGGNAADRPPVHLVPHSALRPAAELLAGGTPARGLAPPGPGGKYPGNVLRVC